MDEDRKMRQLAITVCVAITMAAATARPARAGIEQECWIAQAEHPADGATDVPLNTALFSNYMSTGVYDDGLGNLHLRTEAGEEIDLDYPDYCSANCSVAAIPRYPLAPNTTYELYAGDDYRLSFTTGTARDDEPPTIAPGEDDESEGVYFSFEGSADIAYAVVETEDHIDSTHIECNLVVPEGGVFDLRDELLQRPNGEEIGIQVMDHAGNPTWITVTVRSPRTKLPGEEDGCAISAVGSRSRPGPALIALLALAMWSTRRRRRG